MRTALLLTLLWATIAILSAADTPRVPSFIRTDAQREAWRIGWPQLHGPTGDGAAIDCGFTLVDDFTKARKVWTSEALVPSSEINRGGCLRTGYATPVVTAGRVYLYYTWPSGFPEDPSTVTAEQIKALNTGRNDRTDRSDKPGDDVILCVEAATGKTLWKRVFEGQGETLLGSGKGGGHGTMCIHDGKAYAFGMAGWVYCLDAVTGEDVWVANAHPTAHSPNATPLVAEGVLVYRQDGTLFGHDAETGEELWQRGGAFRGNRSASFTRVWRTGKRELLVHENTCYDPRTGEELWTIGDVEGGNTTAVHGNFMITREADKKSGTFGVRCFKLSPTGAELAWWWKEPWVIKRYSSPVFVDGWAAVDMQAPQTTEDRLFGMFELATGKVVTMPSHHKAWKYQPIAAEGKYLYTGGYNVWIARLDPENLEELSDTKVGDFAHDVSPAYACGLLFVRGAKHLECYDLRTR